MDSNNPSLRRVPSAGSLPAVAAANRSTTSIAARQRSRSLHTRPYGRDSMVLTPSLHPSPWGSFSNQGGASGPASVSGPGVPPLLPLLNVSSPASQPGFAFWSSGSTNSITPSSSSDPMRNNSADLRSLALDPAQAQTQDPMFPSAPGGHDASPSTFAATSSSQHRLPTGRFTFASQPLRSQANLAPTGTPSFQGPDARYTFLSAPSSSEDIGQQSPDVSLAGQLNGRYPTRPPLNAATAARDAPWTQPHPPRMTGTGGGYGYISGSTDSGLSLTEPETTAGSSDEYRASDSSSDATPAEDDPLLALQRLTIDLYEQKHSVPSLPDETDASSPAGTTLNHLFPGSSGTSEQEPMTSKAPSPRPTTPTPEAATPCPLYPPSPPAAPVPPLPREHNNHEVTPPPWPADHNDHQVPPPLPGDSNPNHPATVSPLLTEAPHDSSIERANSSTAAPASTSPASYRTVSPPVTRTSATPTSPHFPSDPTPRLSTSPKFSVPSSVPEDEYEQPSHVGTKRARQATPHAAQPAQRRRTGRPRRRSREPVTVAPSAPGHEDPEPSGNAHRSVNGMSVCDYVDPLSGAYCGRQFHRLYDLVRHRETIHAKEEAKAIREGQMAMEQALVWGKEIDPSSSTVDTEWRCPTCGGNFSRKDALLRHKRLRAH